jgi:hypothetical protein
MASQLGFLIIDMGIQYVGHQIDEAAFNEDVPNRTARALVSSSNFLGAGMLPSLPCWISTVRETQDASISRQGVIGNLIGDGFGVSARYSWRVMYRFSDRMISFLVSQHVDRTGPFNGHVIACCHQNLQRGPNTAVRAWPPQQRYIAALNGSRDPGDVERIGLAVPAVLRLGHHRRFDDLPALIGQQPGNAGAVTTNSFHHEQRRQFDDPTGRPTSGASQPSRIGREYRLVQLGAGACVDNGDRVTGGMGIDPYQP